MIAVENLKVRAGDFRLEGLSFTVPKGQYAVLMGRTGSGKTTILESILGLRRVVAGRIHVAGTDVTNLNPAVRGIGYVPQDGALFEQMTVRDHLSFALGIRRVPAGVIADRVTGLAQLLGIIPLLDRTPHGLSGGERQRVALGRALSFRPAVLCLDEPLSALDAETRSQMCELLRSIRTTEDVTTLHVTHSHEEAEQLADCLLTLSGGRVQLADPSKEEC